ncbi:MAG TPA: circularly permuted type 2 ATP-grasp protein [Vicinamibacterales bacterium]
MTSAADPIQVWHSLIRAGVEGTPEYWQELSSRMRAARLTFGDRPLCPFLRPFFLSSAEAARVAPVCEAIAAMGERVVRAAMESPALLRDVRLTPAEERLVRIDPGYGCASTSSRLDAFLLPDSLKFAEYNAESPAGLAYSENLAGIFDNLEIMAGFRQQFETRSFRLSDAILDALLESYREWGGTANPPTILITDWREVPTWSEFEILQARFEARGVPTVVADPRDLSFDGNVLVAADRRIDMIYRRVLMTDLVARPDECAALLRAVESGRICMANSLRCKIPHKKAFFAVLTGERHAHLFSPSEQAIIRNHIPWTRIVEDTRTTWEGETVDLLSAIRRRRERLVLKPNDEYGGSGVTLGWEATTSAWDDAIERAVSDPSSAWVVQERIPVRREPFPVMTGTGIELREMLVDFAPYIFRGRQHGYLTRLSTSGLANVTSGGGQVPTFVIHQP